ncbi:hypothetical protein X756_32240 [Mesorhizobium sp. LSHC412B00]|nr:hypothetical protein X756_32240 [Mesorhizobium sp. LSHC412B00]
MTFRELGVTFAVQISTPNGLRPVLFQLFKALIDALGFTARNNHSLWPGTGVSHVERGIDIGSRLASRPDAINRMIACYGHQPGDWAEIRNSETIRLRPHFDEDLLQRFFRISAILQYTKAHAEKFRTGLPVKQIERSPILHRGPDNQGGDILRRHTDKLSDHDLFAKAEILLSTQTMSAPDRQ